MRAMNVFLSAAVCVALLCGCTTKIVMKPTGTKIGGGIETTNGNLVDERSSFRVTDERAVAWVEFANAYQSHTARFKWFNPRDELVLDSGPVPVTNDDKLYVRRRVWSTLPIRNAPAQFMTGGWEVQVLFDGKKIETLKFDLKG